MFLNFSTQYSIDCRQYICSSIKIFPHNNIVLLSLSTIFYLFNTVKKVPFFKIILINGCIIFSK